MKLLKIKVNSIKENDIKDLLINYDTLVLDNGVEYTITNMESIFEYKFDILTSVERPKGIKINIITKAILEYLIENKYIKEEK